MYLGVDVGGTKTLLAALSEDGQIGLSERFFTPTEYQPFLNQFSESYNQLEAANSFERGAVGTAGTLDRQNGRLLRSGNVNWKNVDYKADLERITGLQLIIENDAKVAALYQAKQLAGRYRKVLYIGVGTGIAIGLVVDGQIDINIGDGGGNTLLIERNGQFVPWESFASGRAIKEEYGQEARDINEASRWSSISRNLAVGLSVLVGLIEPEVIVIGGGIGEYLDRFKDILTAELDKCLPQNISQPDIVQANHSAQSVIYGCYELLKQA